MKTLCKTVSVINSSNIGSSSFLVQGDTFSCFYSKAKLDLSFLSLFLAVYN